MHLCRSQRWFAVFLLIWGCATVAHAQFPGAPNLPGGWGVPGNPGATPLGDVLLHAPLQTLTPLLRLDTKQAREIAAIQQQTVQQIGTLTGQQIHDMMPIDFKKLNDRQDRLVSGLMRKVRAVLTSQQRQALLRALLEIQAVSMAGIPQEVLGKLKLTDTQNTRIEKIVRSDRERLDAKGRRMPRNSQIGGMEFRTMARDMRRIQDHTFRQSLAVLTPKQRSMVTRYLQLHPPSELPRDFDIGPQVIIQGPTVHPDGTTTIITTTGP